MAVARKLALPIFLADPAALSLIGRPGGAEGGGRGCSVLCTGRPVTAFAAVADHWKYDVSQAPHIQQSYPPSLLLLLYSCETAS